MTICMIFTIPSGGVNADIGKEYAGKWNWDLSVPMLPDLENWYTYDEAWVNIINITGNEAEFEYYHQRGGVHLYVYDICTGVIDGNTITGYTNARKVPGDRIFAEFKVTLSFNEDFMWLEAYNLTEDGVAFSGCFYKEQQLQITVEEKESEDISVFINNEETVFDQPPVIQNDRVLVPMRMIFEIMGYMVDWYENSQTAAAYKEERIIEVQIGNHDIKYTAEGRNHIYTCDVKPQVIDGRTLVPLRAVAECAGCPVEWDEENNSVIINF